MMPAIIVAVYLCVVLYIGIFAFRKGTGSRDDFFVAGRSLGPYVFILSLFGFRHAKKFEAERVAQEPIKTKEFETTNA